MFNTLIKNISTTTGPLARAATVEEQRKLQRSGSQEMPTLTVNSEIIAQLHGLNSGGSLGKPPLFSEYENRLKEVQQAITNREQLSLRAQYDPKTGAPTQDLGPTPQDTRARGILSKLQKGDEVFAVGLHPSVLTSPEARGKTYIVAEHNPTQLARLENALGVAGFMGASSNNEEHKDFTDAMGTSVSLRLGSAESVLAEIPGPVKAIIDNNAMTIYSEHSGTIRDFCMDKLSPGGIFSYTVAGECQGTEFPNALTVKNLNPHKDVITGRDEAFQGMRAPISINVNYDTENDPAAFLEALKNEKGTDIGGASLLRYSVVTQKPGLPPS